LDGATGKPVEIGIRPEHFSRGAEAKGTGFETAVQAHMIEPLGMDTLVHFAFAGKAAVARVSPHLALRRGSELTLRADPANIYVFDRESGVALHAC